MSNSFAVLGGFESENLDDFQLPKAEQKPKKKPEKKKTVPVNVIDKKSETFKKNPKARARGHVDRAKLPVRKNKRHFDRSKPGKIKKGGAGKGNWGKNDGKAQADKFIEQEEDTTQVTTEETPATEEAPATEETAVEETTEEVEEEEENTISLDEYMKQHQSSVAKKGRHKVDNSNLDDKLQKVQTKTVNTGVSSSKNGKKAKNKRRRKGMDLNHFLEVAGPTNGKRKSNKGNGQRQQRQKAGKTPNLRDKEAFPPL